MHRMVLLLVVSLLLVPVLILASQVTVPDDYATIQAALNSGADTVFVRPGDYPEALVKNDGDAQSLLALPRYLGPWRPSVSPPVVTSLSMPGSSTAYEFAVRGFVFTGPVSVSRDVVIEQCWLGAGLTLGVGHPRILGNIIFGDVTGFPSDCDIAMNTIIGGTISVNPASASLTSRNVVLGPAPTGIVVYEDLHAIDNYVRGCENGLALGEGYSSATGNVVEDCSGAGITVVMHGGIGPDAVSDNIVRRCAGDGIQITGVRSPAVSGNTIDSVGGAGILSRTCELTATGNTIRDAGGVGMDLGSLGVSFTVADNHVTRSGSDGVVMGGGTLAVAGNVVGRSGGRGLVVTGEEVTVRSNTLYLNADAGLDLSGTSSAGVDSVDHNIAYQNDVGLRWDGFGTAVLGCNDWYANATANTQGISPGATDLSLNPLFCDMAADDVSLSAVSALLNPAGCGLIGALGEGCPYPAAVTPEPGAVLSGLGVFPQPGRGEVRLSWQKTNDVTEVAIYDVTGARRWSATAAPGAGEVVWRGVDDEGRPLPAGVYFARVRSGERQAAANVVLVR